MAEYSSLKVAELKEILKQRGLPLSGTKAELVERLKQADAAAEPEAAPEPEAEQPAEKPEETAEDQPEPEAAPEPEKPAEPAEPEANGKREAAEAEEAAPDGVTEEESQRVIEELNKRIARGKRFGDEESVKETEAMLKRVQKFGLDREQVNKILHIKRARVGKAPKPAKAAIDDEEKLRRRKERFAA